IGAMPPWQQHRNSFHQVTWLRRKGFAFSPKPKNNILTAGLDLQSAGLDLQSRPQKIKCIDIQQQKTRLDKIEALDGFL
ncbi:MAG: hypothetical protein WCL14_13500, partial [Bacteroidota bacterium]